MCCSMAYPENLGDADIDVLTEAPQKHLSRIQTGEHSTAQNYSTTNCISIFCSNPVAFGLSKKREMTIFSFRFYK